MSERPRQNSCVLFLVEFFKLIAPLIREWHHRMRGNSCLYRLAVDPCVHSDGTLGRVKTEMFNFKYIKERWRTPPNRIMFGYHFVVVSIPRHLQSWG